jgi:hypothetical protein
MAKQLLSWVIQILLISCVSVTGLFGVADPVLFPQLIKIEGFTSRTKLICMYDLYRVVMLLLVPIFMFFKYFKPSKVQNLDKHSNKKIVVLIYCSVSC